MLTSFIREYVFSAFLFADTAALIGCCHAVYFAVVQQHFAAMNAQSIRRINVMWCIDIVA